MKPDANIAEAKSPLQRRVRILGGMLTAGAVFAAVAILLLVGSALRSAAGLPPLPSHPPPAVPAAVLLTAQGEPFARRGERQEEPVDAARLPAHVTRPFISIEDRRFYHHRGLDFRGAARAALANLRAGRVVQGGSTITQQLVKNVYFGNERTFRRKFDEAAAALVIERRATKNQILSSYLDTIYFGEGAYGLAAAAHVYFDKTPAELTVGEAAMLAGLVKAPSRLNPSENPKLASDRQLVVLRALVEDGFLAPADVAAARDVRLVQRSPRTSYGGHFADLAYSGAVDSLPPQYGEQEVRTTLDGDLQKLAETVLQKALSREGGRMGASQGALVAMRTDGSVVAMVGGRDYSASQFNRTTQARRQPGSTFKLFVYLAALRAGATPDWIVSDGPIKIGSWSPRNADGRHHGLLTLEEAFARSSNLAAIRVSEYVGRDQVVRAARDLGVTSKIDSVPSLALGTSAVSLLELTQAYAAVAAGRYPVKARLVNDAPLAAQAAMDPVIERGPMLRLLQSAAETGTGRAANLPIPVFGKTGTTQNSRDALFVGFAGDLVVGVWIGNDDGAPMSSASGGGLPARIWREFMTTALKEEIAWASDAGTQVEPDSIHEPQPIPERRWLDRMSRWFGA